MKTITKLMFALGLTTVLLATSGCAVGVGVRVPGAVIYAPPAPVVVAEPVAAVDWWYDGATYYYLEPASGMYFYYGFNGAIVWCARGWYPHPGWHHIGRPVYHPMFHGGHFGGWHSAPHGTPHGMPHGGPRGYRR